ncbi:hypothetical protein BFW01_g5293 [Lasiodiplodia theobromae]|uniref:Uncharacterized protein n=2 Tax=Lasiodiplodia TaxID=66739 RepID=A0A5N5D543_9PEZI|nr:uncharacterized protein LTHEOB_12645 [Lasiodiplodia theobromae]KAB2572464.1 hypothetical protein DBV05_g8893 [Lasiodiplodia theobromae]KAF4535699.1 hypothetical protein LTHEOB_12645 [Lasiodiplodia theobromae]KAF9634398.1 hypothetical protein BFW01_g5293 [Lasiodiplodia theobromae]KAK0645033.1 hypothetical protein DIS24_g8281 [Lasiodiplodia hormozganensis]
MAPQSRRGSNTNDPYHRYLLLSTQQETLRQRLTLQIPPTMTHEPSYSPRSSFSSDFSTQYSPTHSPSQTPATPHHTAAPSSAASSSPTPDMPGVVQSAHASHHPLRTGQPMPEDSQLYDVNKQVKAVLTELLNTDGVKHDERFRMWVQGRLMETEMEMRRQRRRRSSVDREVLDSIAEHF